MIPLPMAPLVPSEPMVGEERQMARGISGCHNQLNKVIEHVFEASTILGAVTTVLQARGLISEEELAAARKTEADRLLAVFQERQLGVQMDMRTPDKYSIDPDTLPVIDCESRYSSCRAACCGLRFAISKQDIEEGVVRWELGHPYQNRVGGDFLCAHLDRRNNHCSIYKQRPGICRTYDCRTDRRIWLDFEARVINPNLFSEHEDGTWDLKLGPPPGEEPGVDGRKSDRAMDGE